MLAMIRAQPARPPHLPRASASPMAIAALA
jgi:hypothetical protein